MFYAYCLILKWTLLILKHFALNYSNGRTITTQRINIQAILQSQTQVQLSTKLRTSYLKRFANSLAAVRPHLPSDESWRKEALDGLPASESRTPGKNISRRNSSSGGLCFSQLEAFTREGTIILCSTCTLLPTLWINQSWVTFLCGCQMAWVRPEVAKRGHTSSLKTSSNLIHVVSAASLWKLYLFSTITPLDILNHHRLWCWKSVLLV